MIGDLIRAYAAGRAARLAREPFDWQPRHFRPAVRELYRLGWRDTDHRARDGHPQLALALAVPAAMPPLQSSTTTANVVSAGNTIGTAR